MTREDVVGRGGRFGEASKNFLGEIYLSAQTQNLKGRIFWQNSTLKWRKDRNPAWKFCAQRSLEIMGLRGMNSQK